MKKIEKKIDNLIDNILSDMSEYVSEYLKYFKFTPNMITSLSVICSFICIYYLYNLNYILASLFFFLTYFFDVLDGYYARKYKMETYFGDLYDHYSDYIHYICIYYLIFFKVPIKHKNYIIIILIILGLGAIIHLGCTEHYNKASENVNSQLSSLRSICYKKEYINYTKYFGPGTNVLFITLLLLYQHQQ